MTHDCYDCVGGPTTHGTFGPKSEKFAAECCICRTEEGGAEHASNVDAGCMTSPDVTCGKYDVASTVIGAHKICDSDSDNVFVCGAAVVSDHSMVLNWTDSGDEAFDPVDGESNVVGKCAAATGGGDIVTDRACIVTW